MESLKAIVVISISMCIIVAASGDPSSQRAATSQPASQLASGVTVAVLDYEATVPGNKDMGMQISDVLAARLSMETALQLVEREKFGRIMEEHKLTLVGLVNQEQAAQVGKLMGAKLLVMGKAFKMDQKLMIVTKVVGVETGLMKGSIRTVDLTSPLSDTVMLLSDDIAALIRKDAAGLLPEGGKLDDPIAAVMATLGNRPRPTVAVVVPERHITRPVIDPAVETELKKTLLDCKFKLVDIGKNDLADWAKGMLKDKDQPWPAALNDADFVVVGEAFSEFAARNGELVTCAARAEINVIDRRTGKIVAADRRTTRAVDLSEAIAGKTALQMAGRQLGVEIVRKLAELTAAGPASNPATKPAAQLDSTPTGDRRIARTARSEIMMMADGPRVPTSTPATRPAASRTVFNVPLDNATGDEQYSPVAAGLGDLVAALLAGQDGVKVVERQRLDALTSEQARSLKGLTGAKFAVAAGKLVKADTVLTGRLFLVQGKLRANVQALDIATERVLAGDEIACQSEDLVESALQLSRGLAKQMSLPLPELDPKKVDKSPLASLHFAKALSSYYAGNMDAAIMQFMQAVDLDPGYTEASYWSGLCYAKLGENAHAAIELEQFLRDSPDSPYAPDAKRMLAEARPPAKEPAATKPGPTSLPLSAETTSKPATSTKPDPADADRQNRKSLDLAWTYLNAGMADKARPYVEKVLAGAPGADIAKEARDLLDRIDKP